MASTYTTRLGLEKPGTADRNWDIPLRAALDLLDGLAALGPLSVRAAELPSASLNVRVSAGNYRKTDGSVGAYAGTSSVAVAASSTKALWLTNAGTLTQGASFPTTPHVRLATVTTGAGTVTAIVDERIAYGVAGV